MSLIHYLLAGISAQRPAHSLFIGGMQLPLEARVGGIFSGIFLGLLFFTLLRRERSLVYPSGGVAVLLLAFVGLLGLDGLNALLYDLGRPHFYPPSNPLRLATGLLTGLSLAAFSLPSVASVLWREGEADAPLQGMGDLAGGVALLALFWLLAVADVAALLYPVAFVFTAGVLLALAEANLYFIGLVRRWRAEGWRTASLVLALGCTLGVTELLAFRALRLWLFELYGITWVG